MLMDPMTVVDPNNKMNNITRSAFRIGDIQERFRITYGEIATNEIRFSESYKISKQAAHAECKDIIT